MPKIIEDVRERALRETRAQILEKGMGILTMRSVASACGIAVGTLYNYFPSKDMLIASAMLEDWIKCLHYMRKYAVAADTLLQGLEAVYDQIIVFSDIYAREWVKYQMNTGTMTFLGEKHRQLVRQLTDVIAPLAGRTAGLDIGGEKDIFCRSAVELLLQQAVRTGTGGFAEIAPVLEKILS